LQDDIASDPQHDENNPDHTPDHLDDQGDGHGHAPADSAVHDGAASVETVVVAGPPSFTSLGLRPELLKALIGLGYEEPTPIQRETIPLLIEGRDLVGQAATGTGKTAAFALPILQLVEKSKRRPEPIALVLVPTRELAVQVSEAMYKYGRDLGAKVVPVYGGQPIGRQLDALRDGVHVVVATPGRALDHIARGTLPLDSVRMVVLDEADEMLDMGFADDIEEILRATPTDRQTVLFSATMPPRINSIAKRHLRDPLKIQIGLGDTKPGKALVRQTAYYMQRGHKAAALGRILDIEAPAAAIVFCRTRHEVDQLTETMTGRGYKAEALHGGMSQDQRDRVMTRVRNGKTELLIATDVAARGLDIDQLTHVVNYDVPAAPESYVHRIGRVGRAGREGVAITLAEPKEQRLLSNIERLTKQKIAVEKVPTVADLRARQIEVTITNVREMMESKDLEKYSPVLDAFGEEIDLRAVALAAIKLAHAATGATVNEKEIPDVMDRMARDNDRGSRPGSSAGAGYGAGSGYGSSKAGAAERWPTKADKSRSGAPDRGSDRGFDRAPADRGPARGSDRNRPYTPGADREPAPAWNAAPARDRSDSRPERAERPARATSGSRPDPGDVGAVYVGVGRAAGIRPGDLVGAIANESNLSGKEIGPIKITEHYSIVGVPADAVDHVVDVLKGTTIKGRSAAVRRYED
jgi:ATP-dependent RNA helicase DeaD